MKKSNKFLTILIAMVMVLGSFSSAFACTGVYIGSALTDNGSTFMGRSEDIGDRYGKVFSVAAPQTLTDESVFKDTYGFQMKYSDLEFDYPTTTYSYTYVRDSYLYGETMKDSDGNYVGEAYAEAGQNEKGVAMTATVSTSYNRTVRTADPLVRNGICEVSMTSIMLGGAATAREAVEILAEIIDKYGAGECNSLMISDAKETWYFEIVSGHQYAAVKMPADKVSVQPNIMLLGVIDVTDTENVIASENLVTLPAEKGFLVTDESGKIDVLKTYGTPSGGSKRYWQGMFYFNEELANANPPAQGSTMDYALLNDTTKTLSTLDILNFLAYRGEGSAWDYSGQPNLGNSNVIGTRSQSECHIFETRHDMVDELAVLQWQAMADAEFSIFVPYYSALVRETSDLYHTEAIPRNIDTLTGDTEGQINTNFHLINYLCDMNRATDPAVGKAVEAYFEQYQQSLIDQQEDVDTIMEQIYYHAPSQLENVATDLGKDLAQQVSEVSSAVLAEVRAYFIADEEGAEFALSEETKAMMPVYTVPEEYLPEHTYKAFNTDKIHWYMCSTCYDVTAYESHTYNDGICECGFVEPLPTVQAPTINSVEGVNVSLSAFGSIATISVDTGYQLLDVTVNGISKGAVDVVAGLKTGDVVSIAAEKIISEEEALIASLAEIKLDADSELVTMNTGKKAIKITWSGDEKVKLDGVEIFRSVKRYSGYSQKPVFVSKTNKYYNTAIEKGNTYYYKVRGYVEISGEKYYTGWSTKAWRTVK